MGGGKYNQAETTNLGVQQEQADILKTQTAQSQANYERMLQLEQPEIGFLQSLLSGDKTKQMSAAAPIVGEISSGYTAAKESIFNNVSPGAGRDVALSNLELQKDTG